MAVIKDSIPEQPTRKEVYRDNKEKRKAEEKDYMPVKDAKNTIEITYKAKPTIEQIEKIEKIPDSFSIERKIRVKKQEKRKDSLEKIKKLGKETIEVSSKPKKIVQMKGNSILIITEKPQAAAKIASALSNGTDRKYSDNGVPYYEFEREGEHIIVSCAVGHLFSLSQDVKGSDYPIFEVSWKPNFEVRKKDFTRKYYSNLSKLIKRAKEIIIASDYDVEGEVIGYNIVRFLANQKDAKRMKFSSLTKDELEEAYKHPEPTLNWGHAMAGETRHFIDWYYGINLSRALMNAIKTTGKFQIMSIGRVQGPALNMIVQKEKEIQAFKPVPFWKIYIDVIDKKDKKNKLRLKHIKDIFEEKELKKFIELKGKEADVTTEKSIQTIAPPVPFDLTTLQTEAYRLVGSNPAKTLKLAQELYLAGLISYPRTSSQKIPMAINPKNILKKLSNHFPQTKLAVKTQPVEGKKTDPAHPSISPTGEYSDLEGDLKKLYELIVKRFISCFCEDAKVENKTITATTIPEKLVFKEKGAEIKEPGWMQVYESKIQEKEIKDMNGKADIINVETEQTETQPPKRYSPASLITELEKKNLGTKSTRANIIETLYDRNYIRGDRSIEATALGIDLINTLAKYSPVIIEEKLTRDLEDNLENMQEAKKDLNKEQESVLKKARSALKYISEDFKKKEAVIGKELISARQESWKKEAVDNQIAQCPTCKKGNLTIKYSPKNKKHFIACSAYPACTQTYSLPPYGLIKKLGDDKKCDKCGFPLLMALQKGKRPWIFCFNPECPSRQEQRDRQEQRQNEKDNQEDKTDSIEKETSSTEEE